jgi:histidyl-tRNA synthetase
LPGIPFTVHTNNLGGRNTLPDYNKAVADALMKHRSGLSELSQIRLDSGYGVRVLDSKPDRDFLEEIKQDLPDIDSFITDQKQSQFMELSGLLEDAGV